MFEDSRLIFSHILFGTMDIPEWFWPETGCFLRLRKCYKERKNSYLSILTNWYDLRIVVWHVVIGLISRLMQFIWKSSFNGNFSMDYTRNWVFPHPHEWCSKERSEKSLNPIWFKSHVLANSLKSWWFGNHIWTNYPWFSLWISTFWCKTIALMHIFSWESTQ